MTTIDSIDARPLTGRIANYARLGKARIYHHAYGWLLAVLLLRLDGLVDRTTAVGIGLLLLALLATQWSGGAADDLGGYRDGSDAQNYAGRPARTVLKKPLLTGALTEGEAIRFAVICWIVAVASGIGAAVDLDGRTPLLASAVLLAAQICSMQYSLGMKLSYRPLGLETTILFVIFCTAAIPYWFVAGRLSAEILYTGVLLGLWFLLIVSYGNASDREGDAAVNRFTLAVMVSPARFPIVLGALVLASIAAAVGLFTTTRLQPALIVFVVPVMAIHLAQFYFGAIRKELRKARFVGLMSVDAGSIGLAVAFLLSA